MTGPATDLCRWFAEESNVSSRVATTEQNSNRDLVKIAGHLATIGDGLCKQYRVRRRNCLHDRVNGLLNNFIGNFMSTPVKVVGWVREFFYSLPVVEVREEKIASVETKCESTRRNI